MKFWCWSLGLCVEYKGPNLQTTGEPFVAKVLSQKVRNIWNESRVIVAPKVSRCSSLGLAVALLVLTQEDLVVSYVLFLVVSIGLFWFSFMPFSYNGVYFQHHLPPTHPPHPPPSLLTLFHSYSPALRNVTLIIHWNLFD